MSSYPSRRSLCGGSVVVLLWAVVLVALALERSCMLVLAERQQRQQRRRRRQRQRQRKQQELLEAQALAEEAAAEVDEKSAPVPYFVDAGTNERHEEVRYAETFGDVEINSAQAGYEKLGMARNGKFRTKPGCTPAEGLDYSSLSEQDRKTINGKLLYSQGTESAADDVDENGEVFDDDWDCYGNHYNYYDWKELALDPAYHSVHSAIVTLGISTEAQWNYTGSNYSVYDDGSAFQRDTWWRGMKDKEKRAAEFLCYTKYTWDNGCS